MKGPTVLDTDLEVFAGQIADQVESFLLATQAVAHEGDSGRAIPILLLEMAQISLAGARLGAQVDFRPSAEHQPDVGMEGDMDDLRRALAVALGPVDAYSFVFDPYDLEVVESLLSDDVTSIAADLENGLRHYRRGDVVEALWWWQFSYVSSWGNLAGAALNALWSVVHHARLDVENPLDEEVVAVADEILVNRSEAPD
ncbi:DUF5063 domain-containing protein [Nocardioides jishulii]|uniref:DUF5063 domain-containing protein n=1 Tax=Nocardioides jishulii TaxID=2575440 RepID=A0A4U2YVU7_9ACTN|nr:DUF5063 domain-containing protein [Nocardioides jishulii]QCX28842.1 DUF5063 domain-containing protein [Nocardioides jishulii]TKI64261.1 DUF5063 domain-containing protein [Nocardioides jishulii]